MVQVEGGTFQMGKIGVATPVHEVTLSSFSIGKYEVTQEQYSAVMGNNPSYFKGAQLPVETVSWYEAAEFCNALSEKEGLEKVYTIDGTTVTPEWTKNGYRLPTEAEWEYAARGGKLSKDYKYAGSDTAGDVAWYYYGNSRDTTHNVGTKAPNELGLYDMSGNVWEWCWDWHDTYGSGAETNPTGASSGSYRVYRGGSWLHPAENLRSAFRFFSTPSRWGNHLGFRLVRR